jgi:PAS domain S-box-containing protein
MSDLPEPAATDVPVSAGEARLQAILDNAVDGIVTISERGVIQSANPATERLFGYALNEIVGQNVKILMPPAYAEQHDGHLANYLKTGEARIIGVGREVEGQRKDGSKFPMYLSVSEVRIGRQRTFTGILQDLSDLRRAEEEGTRLGRILEDSLDEIYLFHPETLLFELVNRGARDNLGYSMAELIRLTPVDITPNFTKPQFLEFVAPLASGASRVLALRTVHQRKDGTTYPAEVHLQLSRVGGKAVYVAITSDITERQQTEVALRESEERFQQLAKHVQEVFWLQDVDTRAILYVSPAYERIFGRTCESLYETPSLFIESVHFDDREHVQAGLQQAADNPIEFEYRIKHSNGTERWIRARVFPVNDDNGKRIAGISEDITERRQAAEEIRRERDFANSLVETAHAIVLVLDVDGKIVRFNQFTEDLTGYDADDVNGKDWFDNLIPERERDRVRAVFERALAGEEIGGNVNVITTRDGVERDITWFAQAIRDPDGTITGVLSIGHDITDLREAQRQLVQSERLAAIGQMVTGLAHESRNALQRARACLDMLSLDLEEQPEQLDLTVRAKTALDDLHRLYEEVKNYAAPIQLASSTCDLRLVWKQVWKNLQVSFNRRTIELIEHDHQVDLTCRIDRYRIEQVFRNILENSIAACPDPGRIDVECGEVEVSGRACVQVTFRDNGAGFGNDTQPHVFQPFFTTKQKGTGLGLAIAKRIVETHEGQIEIGRNCESGAEVIVTLPR